MDQNVVPLPAEEWSDEVWSALATIGVARPPQEQLAFWTSNLLGVYAHNPAFMAGWMPFSQHLKSSTLGPRNRELVILRTTWVGGGEYEWVEHRAIALVAGTLTTTEADALEAPVEATDWPEHEAVLLRATDEFVVRRAVTRETWARLGQYFTPAQLVDFTFMVGTYDMHTAAFASMGLTLESGKIGFPAYRADRVATIIAAVRA